MRLYDRMTDYLFERDFALKYRCNQLTILNYKDIIFFSNNLIRISYALGQVVFTGKNLVVNRLMNEELSITCMIQSIEFVVSS